MTPTVFGLCIFPFCLGGSGAGVRLRLPGQVTGGGQPVLLPRVEGGLVAAEFKRDLTERPAERGAKIDQC